MESPRALARSVPSSSTAPTSQRIGRATLATALDVPVEEATAGDGFSFSLPSSPCFRPGDKVPITRDLFFCVRKNRRGSLDSERGTPFPPWVQIPPLRLPGARELEWYSICFRVLIDGFAALTPIALNFLPYVE